MVLLYSNLICNGYNLSCKHGSQENGKYYQPNNHALYLTLEGLSRLVWWRRYHTGITLHLKQRKLFNAYITTCQYAMFWYMKMTQLVTNPHQLCMLTLACGILFLLWCCALLFFCSCLYILRTLQPFLPGLDHINTAFTVGWLVYYVYYSLEMTRIVEVIHCWVSNEAS